MRKLGVILLVSALVLVCICLILALAGYLLYSNQRERAVENRPLVMIHAPINHDRIPLGDGVLPHATARADDGVARIELWVDGEFVAADASPGQRTLSPLVLSTGWEPVTLGSHILLVRTISADGVAGQAMVTVEVIEPAEADVAEHVVQEGETLESIAADEGVGMDELVVLNPAPETDELEPGDVVLYSE